MLNELIKDWIKDLEEKVAATPNKFDDFAVKILKAILSVFL